MPVITYIEHSGREHRIDLPIGGNLMQGAVSNGISGIDGDCGGACACATCHILVDPAWIARVGDRNPVEASMLEFAEGVQDTSRLACQIKASADLDGLVVRLPAAQH